MTRGVAAGRPELAVDRAGGVTVLTPSEPGPAENVAAVLTFRVGISDETVVVRGITHLVEHLAVSRFHSGTLSWNASVDLTRTRFTARGPAGEVARFFAEVTSALATLPADRLDHERRVLQIETGSRPQGIPSSLLTTRFGLQGPGVAPYPEWGLEWLDTDRTQAWADEWFTASNAVLWATAALPNPELGLPAGRPRPPRIHVPPRRFPAAQVRDGNVLVATSLVPRTVAQSVAVMELERSLRGLRHEDGLSYQPGVSFYALSADHALVTATADVHPELVVEATEAFQAVLRDLAATSPSEQNLDAHRRNLMAPAAGEEAAMASLDTMAMALLFGVADPLVDPVPTALAALTADDVQSAGGELLDQVLLAVPADGFDAVLPPFDSYEPEPIPPVEGRTMRSSDPAVDHSVRLVYGDEGVTHWDEWGESLTVRFDACSGMVAWPDGRRLIYGTDGSGLLLDPRQWLQFSRIRECLDRNAPAYVARLPVSLDRPAPTPVSPALWFVRRTVDRLPWGLVVTIAAVMAGALIGALGVGLGAALEFVIGELAWLGEYRDRVLVLLVMFGLIAAVSWWEHRRKKIAQAERAARKRLAGH